jgi:MFS family permease
VGRRRTFLIGLVSFAGASAPGGASTSFAMLVIARGTQGAFGALLAPSALSVLTTTFVEPSERGKAFGVYGAIAGSGGAMGLLLGGVLTEYLNWRWCLYVNVGLAVVALVGALRLLADQPRDPNVRLGPRGTLPALTGLVAFVYGMAEAATSGWGAPLTVALIVIGVALLAGFVLVERRVEHPLLPLRVVLNRYRGGSYLAIGLTAIGLFGIFLFLTYYLQLTLHLRPPSGARDHRREVGQYCPLRRASIGLYCPVIVPSGGRGGAGGASGLAILSRRPAATREPACQTATS